MSPTTPLSGEADLEGQLHSTAASTLKHISLQSSAPNNVVPLSKWLEERRPASSSQKATAPQCYLIHEDLEERLKIAAAITKGLSDIHEGKAKVGWDGARSCDRRLLMENILLEVHDGGYCGVTLNLSADGEGSKEEDMKQLGDILNAIFDGPSDEVAGEQEAEQKTGQDRPAKKREKGGQPTAEHLPLYLSCVISTLVSNNMGTDPSEAQYLSFKDVLQDLQAFAAKPEVYLRKDGRGDAKNNLQWTASRDSFYGRKSELSLLLHGLDAVLRFGHPAVVAVSGYAGTGKTCLLKQVEEPLKNAGGLIIRGKFNTRTSSDLAIFSAFNSFFGEINGGSAAVQAQLRSRISKYVGCGLGVLVQAIPNLRTLMMKEEECCETDIEFDIFETARQRWQFLFCKLINVISDYRPLAIHFDDLHWCDESTLDMIKALVVDPEIRYCLFLVSYRINGDADKLLGVTKVLDSIQTHGVRLVSLRLSSIEKESVNSLISEMLCKPPSLCTPLSKVVHQKTGGSVFLYAIDFFKSLQEEGMVKFNLKTRNWEYNLNEIRQKKVRIDVVQHLSERMQKLPKKIQYLLKTAAILDFEVDRDLLQMAMEGSIELLPYAIESGFLQEIPSPTPHPRIVWSHDEIRTAAYELIPLNKRMASHLLIGSRIFMNISSDELLHKYIFDIVNNMNVGLELLTSQEQRIEVSQLNLTAGKRAMASSSFSTASDYFKVGIGLLAENCWECNYELALVLHQAASEALFVAGEFDSLKNLIDEQLSHAKCLDDKLHAYYTHVTFLRSSNNLKGAAGTTLKVLGELGHTFSSPSDTMPDLIYKQLASVKHRLKNVTEEDILKGPRMTDEKIMWTMRFHDSLLFSLSLTQPNRRSPVACRLVSLSLDYGCCIHSATGFLVYGLACYDFMKDIEECYRWGKISTMFLREGVSRVKCYFYLLMSFMKEPIQATCEELLKCYQDLLMVGDIECAMIALSYHPRQGLFAGKELATVETECSFTTAKMANHRQTHLLLHHCSHHLIVLKLTGGDRTTNPFDALSGLLDGEINDEETLLEHTISTGKKSLELAILFNKMFIAYWFKRYEEAATLSSVYERCGPASPLLDAYHTFYFGLAAFHLARLDSNELKRMEIGESKLSLYKNWVTHSVWNWENKYFLLQAECHFCKGELVEAEGKYKDAIESAQKHRFVHEEGLANELLAALYTSTKSSKKAGRHLSEARTCYERWGAKAIANRV